jgi:hypothetical protein
MDLRENLPGCFVRLTIKSFLVDGLDVIVEVLEVGSRSVEMKI